MNQVLHARLKRVHSRQKFSRGLRFAAWGLLAGSVAGLFCSIVKVSALPELSSWLPAAFTVSGTCLGFIVGLLWPQKWYAAASAIDSHYTLKDRALAAWEFGNKPQRSSVHQLAMDDALAHLENVSPQQVVPYRMPRVLPYALATFCVTMLTLMFAIWNAPIIAAPPEALDVVVAQADRISEEIKELEEFAAKEKDPEVEKLIKELKAAIEELKQPGVDAKEAMAKISEMQAALQAEQIKNNPQAMDAQFKAIGEALALTPALAEAGQALSAGEYDKAAQHLEQVELPKLDRQTEKAMKEKLDAAAKQQSNNGQNSLSEATDKVSQGLGGDGKNFSEGSKKLAGEAGKQGKRKKLSDLLKKQCDCLSECKCECEGECNNPGSNSRPAKGGKKAGTSGTGGDLADKTPMIGSKKQEKITGKQGNEGETEVETTHSLEDSQQAHREYRQNYSKYKKISESVLENEPIPLGQRQTIRKYFESIRPSDAQVDQVNESVLETK